MKVAERFDIKGRGAIVILDPPQIGVPRVGDLIVAVSGDGYRIVGVESTLVGDGLRGPHGLLLSVPPGTGPQAGDTVAYHSQPAHLLGIDAAARGPRDPRDLVEEALGWRTYETPGPGGELVLDAAEHAPITLAELTALGRLFCTDKVAIEFEPEEGPWSEWTGGSPARLRIRVSGIMAELAWEDGYPRYAGMKVSGARGWTMSKGVLSRC